VIFTQPVFLAFFLVCFVVHWMVPHALARKAWLLACSYFFYGYWDWRFLSLIFASTLVDFLIGLALARTDAPTARRWIVTGSVVVNLGFLGFFKYFNFFVDSARDLLGWFGVPVADSTLQIVLPVGISFFTFQSMSYTIDVYRREIPAVRRFLDFALFVAFFPQLVAGPIVRARDLLPQFTRNPMLADVEARSCLLLFWVGFFKKACLADNIAAAIDPVFVDPSRYHAADVALSSLLYSVQIYCDFSGYTDMAIATAGLLGYRLVRNFEFPYFSRNIQEFWRRWHISLSTWLRDYLYVSLGGNRGGSVKVARNLMLTMVLGGLWHGANLTFIAWGLLHGAALVAHRFVRGRTARPDEPPGAPRKEGSLGSVALAWGSTLVTFLWVAFCFSIFRSTSLELALEFFERLGSTRGAMKLNVDWWLLLVAMAVVHRFWSTHERAIFQRAGSLGRVPFYFAYGAACAIFPYFMSLNTAPFIYFQF
jgi:alginate O-acetyltransferase complex protein AlgI